jgi:diguanylate cyclase (GGDEF)-like protein
MVARFLHLFSLRRWLTWVAMHPGPVLIGILLLTGFAGTGIPRLTFSPSANDLMVDGLPERQRYEDFKALFGSDEIVRVVVKGGDMFTAEAFDRLRSLSNALARIPGVNRVISLPRIKAAVDPGDRWSVDHFARLATPVSIFKGNLISADHRVSGITLILDDGADQEAVDTAVSKALSRLDNGYSGYQVGMPSVSIALARYAHRDFLHLPLYTVLVIALLLLALFRSVVEMAMPLFGVAVAGIWTLGAMAWTGIPLNMLTVVVPILQIAVGTAYCLYVYCEFRNCVPVCKDACTTLVTAYSRTALPTIIAVGTTLVGIGSLMVTPIGAIRQFSAFAGLGILALLLSVMTFFPCLLVLAWPIIRKRRPDTFECLVSPALVDRLVYWVFNRRPILFIVLALLALVAAAGIFRIQVETNPLSYFRENTAIRRQVDDIHRHLSGSFPLHLEIRGSEEDWFLSLAALRTLADHQRFLGSVPGVDKTLSFADHLMLVNYVTNRFDPAYYTLPDTDIEIRMLVNQFKSLLGRDVLARYVSADFSTANITMLTRLSSCRGFMAAEEMIRSYCRHRQTGGVAFHVTGFGMVMSLGSRHLVTGQVWSLLLTIGMVFALIHMMFLSVRIGAIAMAANLFPILVSFGAMGWLGIDLSMGTCLIASIVVGLAVDDTIHFLARYRLAYLQEMDSQAAMRTTLVQLGRPIISTSVAVSAGFSILMLSSFTPTAVFGMLMMLAMLSALSGSLVILPVLLSTVSPITLEEVFRIRIGGDRLQQTVPLLRGMSRLQVHRIFKSGEIRRIDAGTRLFRQGEVADCMYVVISGVFDAFMNEPAGGCHEHRVGLPKRINRLWVGDVIGEMGPLTSGTRCISVVSAVSGEVLSLSRNQLARIQRLYPRTASRFFNNLSTILAGKLIRADRCLSSTSRLDDDTGLLNRDAFFDCLEKEIHRARRYGDSMAICLLDVDDCDAAFDDNQLAVEHLISQIARVISGNFRAIDTKGRLDGTTLAVLLPGTTSAHRREVCRRLRAAFRSQADFAPIINVAIFCRFLDLECCRSDDAAGPITDATDVIPAALSRKDRHLLYASPHPASG